MIHPLIFIHLLYYNFEHLPNYYIDFHIQNIV